MSSWIRRSLSTATLTFPVAIWFTDWIYSTYRVRGTSMEPALKDGDVVLVRKADRFADSFDHDNNIDIMMGSESADSRELERIVKRIRDGSSYTEDCLSVIRRPPLVLPGHVVVFASPKAAFPSEHHLKRVVGVGGQKVRPRKRFQHIESLPPNFIWVEGDNAGNSEDSTCHGPISRKLVIGKAERIIWPPSRWGKVVRIPPVEGKAWFP